MAAKKPTAVRDEKMTDLNVEIPTELMNRIKVAKVLTGERIRDIAKEALENWLRERGVTPEKMPKLKGEKA
jgi:hypothetical protein